MIDRERSRHLALRFDGQLGAPGTDAGWKNLIDAFEQGPRRIQRRASHAAAQGSEVRTATGGRAEGASGGHDLFCLRGHWLEAEPERHATMPLCADTQRTTRQELLEMQGHGSRVVPRRGALPLRRRLDDDPRQALLPGAQGGGEMIEGCKNA